MTTLRVGQATDVGEVRTNNEDNLLVTERLFAVADGMGGHQGGEVASQTAVDALREAYADSDGSVDALRRAVQAANQAVWDRARASQALTGMGTTLTVVALIGDPPDQELAIANVGDSRTYLYRDGSIAQVTDDHSLVQDMVRRGQLTPEQAVDHPRRNILTRVLGGGPEVEVDTWQVVPYAGDRYLLASDGLPNEMTDDQIASVLRRLADPSDAAAELVRQAKANGGNDNVTVVVLDVVDDDDRSARASAVLAADRDTGAESGGGTPPPRTRLLSHAERDAELQELGPDRDAAPSGGLLDGDAAPTAVAEPSRLTVRVLAFLVVLVLLVGAALGATAWYARASYFVGLDENQVVVFKGRPGGLLWFQPTLVERTGMTATDVLPSRLDDLRAGRLQPSLPAALRYAGNLREEAAAADRASTTTTALRFSDDGPTDPSGSDTTAPIGAPPASSLGSPTGAP